MTKKSGNAQKDTLDQRSVLPCKDLEVYFVVVVVAVVVVVVVVIVVLLLLLLLFL